MVQAALPVFCPAAKIKAMVLPLSRLQVKVPAIAFFPTGLLDGSAAGGDVRLKRRLRRQPEHAPDNAIAEAEGDVAKARSNRQNRAADPRNPVGYGRFWH